MNIDEYQRLASETDVRDRADPAYSLLGLAGEVGSLTAVYKKAWRIGRIASATEAIREELGDLLWYAATLATDLGLSLEEVARLNLSKTRAAWGDHLPSPTYYDAAFASEEQLPRQFAIRFVSTREDDMNIVRIHLGEQAVGDPLDDNSDIDDGYRFHDVFHLAHWAVLGWSPVMRGLLRRKRKSDWQVDRIEDGGRAQALEEGLSAYVFSVAADSNYFEGADRVDWETLKAVRTMVRGLEVANQPVIAWQSAIIQGYAAWRALTANRGGVVYGDIGARSLIFGVQP